MGIPEVGEKQCVERKKKKVWPATLANATTCGARKLPEPTFKLKLKCHFPIPI